MKKIIKFYSPTCCPCKLMSKALETLEGVEIHDIDVTDNSNETLLDKYNIMSIPTIAVLDENDKLIKEFRGVVSIDKIKEVLND